MLLNTNKNGMLLNTNKTKIMPLTTGQNRSGLQKCSLSLNYNDLDLKLTSSEKIFGVHIEENQTWNIHFQFISTKISSSLWLLSQIKSFLSKEDKLLLYNAYIRPHLDYCSVIWGNATNFNINKKITKLQRQACKIILGLY